MCEIFGLFFVLLGLIMALMFILYIPFALLNYAGRSALRKKARHIISGKKKAKFKAICRIIDTLSKNFSGKQRKDLPEKDRWLIEKLREKLEEIK